MEDFKTNSGTFVNFYFYRPFDGPFPDVTLIFESTGLWACLQTSQTILKGLIVQLLLPPHVCVVVVCLLTTPKPSR